VLAKLTVKNQLTLPKSVTQSLGPVQYFEVQEKAGQIILTPVRIQRGDALRAKLAELEIGAKTIESALSWASKKTVAEKTSSPKTPAKKTSAEKTAAPKKVLAKPLSQSAAKKPLRKTGAEKSTEPTVQKTAEKKTLRPGAKNTVKTIEILSRGKTPAKKAVPKPLSEAVVPLAQKLLKKAASEVKEAKRPARPSMEAKASKRASSRAKPGRVSKA